MEEMIYNTYEGEIESYGEFELPIPTYEFDRKIDFSVIVAMLLRSNGNPKEEDYRYVDYNKLNKNAICKECKISRATLDRRLKYLEEKNIITLEKTSKGYIYIIRYSKDGRYYVTIQHRLLKNMLKYTNKDAMKVYILLKIQIELLGNKRPMTNAFIASQLGYSTSSQKNLDNIGSWTNTLANNGFIEKTHHRIYTTNEQGKTIIERVDTYYKLNDLDTWNRKKDKGVHKTSNRS
ncbi:hypothetical protein UT300009_30690 [Paraclostridium bifermentans]